MPGAASLVMVNHLYNRALATEEGTRRVLDLYALKFKSAFPIVLPPGVPRERVAVLQKAFDDTMQDRDFLATAGAAAWM